MKKRAAFKSSGVRGRMLAKIHILWPRLRPDLRHDPEGLREALHDFAAKANNLDSVTSLTQLTDGQLGRLLDEIGKQVPGQATAQRQSASNQESGNVIPGKFGRARESAGVPESGADITHLASPAQVKTIKKLFDEVRWWNGGRREAWLKSRFGVGSIPMLRFDQATSAIRILMNIAVSRLIKLKTPEVKVSRQMINAGIPDLKRRLRIQ